MNLKKILPFALAGALGCMHGGGQAAKKVSDADTGRLGPDQVGLVNRARQELDAAKDALSRTSLRHEQARNEVGIAKAELQAAQADQKVADAQRKVASDSRAPEAIDRARVLQEQATSHKRAAELHVEYAGKLVSQREAEAKVASRKVDVAQAQVEWSKLQALEQAGNPAATKYEAKRFQQAVNEAQKALDEATKDAQSLEAETLAVRRRWEEVQQRTPGSPGQQETGTGSGK